MTIFQREENAICAITLLTACMIAASNIGQVAGVSIWLAYVYWFLRLAIGAALFVGFRTALEKFAPRKLSFWTITALACILSLVPFALAITAFDIVLGYPELGIETAKNQAETRFAEFGLELLYLLDDHVVFCLLLSLPRLMFNARSTDTTKSNENAKNHSFIANLDPPLKGEIMAVEAQEHYVNIITNEESRLVLYRFSDMLRDLLHLEGMQVHRSYWVALEAIEETFRDGTNLRIRLKSGSTIPVSRSYRNAFEHAFDTRNIL